MHNDIHYSRLLFFKEPAPGKQYRQIFVREEGEVFNVMTFEGKLVLSDQTYRAANDFDHSMLSGSLGVRGGSRR